MSFFLRKKKNEDVDSAFMTAAKDGYDKSAKTPLGKDTDKDSALSPEWLRQWKITPKSPLKFH
jgi:hypothetical protein